MKIVLLSLCVLFICGCSITVDKVNSDKFKDKISYFKDERTGLCFAAMAMKKGSITIFNNQNGGNIYLCAMQ
jgi:hypothetical protein